MSRIPRLAIVAHDGKKADLVAFATFNRDQLSQCQLVATSSTGKLLGAKVGLEVECLESGPVGGDVQLADRHFFPILRPARMEGARAVDPAVGVRAEVIA